MNTQDPARRLLPRPYDSDWLVLRGMRRAIDDMAARVARTGAVAIDVGCGSKPYEGLFTSRGCTYLGADFDGSAELHIGSDGRVDSEGGAADVVVSFQVLEHVRDLRRYLGECRRLLKPDGHMVLSTHGTWLYHPHPEDHRRWTRTGLIHDLESHGFDVIECAPVVGPLAWTTMLRLTSWCYGLRRVPLAGSTAAAALSLAMNLRAVVEDAVTPAWVTRDNACVYVTLCRPRAESPT